MKHSCIEFLKDHGWFALPEKLIKKYGRSLGASGVALYSWLAACADIDLSVSFSNTEAGAALGYSETTMRRATRLLKEKKLIKIISTSPKITYQLLWKPCEYSGENSEKTDDALYTFDVSLVLKPLLKTNERAERKKNLSASIRMDHDNALAYELADTLNDQDSISFYIGLTRRYSEQYLRNRLEKALSIPTDKIKRSRAALFNHLVQHGSEKSYSRD